MLGWRMSMRLLADCMLYTLFSWRVKFILEEAFPTSYLLPKNLIPELLPGASSEREEGSMAQVSDLCYCPGKALLSLP
jgi:hypothetical protein